MKDYACYSLTGQYIVTGNCEADLTEFDIPEGCSVYYGDVNITLQYHDTATGTPTSKGTPPADGYKFNYSTKLWEPDNEYLIYKNKIIRNQLLLDCDWTDTLSAKTRLGQALYDQWQTYRQTLRDITLQSTFPLNVVFPTAPE